MKRMWLVLLVTVLMISPLAYAHDPAGTPDTTCEDTAAEWSDHDYGPPAAGLLISGFQESNLEDCDGDFDPSDPFCWAEEVAREDLDGDTDVCEEFDYDEHSEYTRGGAWLLVTSGDGVTGGSVLCFGEAGHHPNFGPVQVDDVVLGQTVPFSVASDTVDETGLGDPCGDFSSDNGSDCVASCSVTFPAGLDGSYQVYVGGSLTEPTVGTQGHVCSPVCPVGTTICAEESSRASEGSTLPSGKAKETFEEVVRRLVRCGRIADWIIQTFGAIAGGLGLLDSGGECQPAVKTNCSHKASGTGWLDHGVENCGFYTASADGTPHLVHPLITPCYHF